MNVVVPPSAFFLREHAGQNSGVDFLGLRQTNLDMMADLIPGINNVTAYIRPFSLLSWIFWKFHQLCVDRGTDEPTSESVRLFRERIETLFTWGARLDDYPNIPGKQAEPPPAGKDGYVPLTFKDWKRVQDSTSLIAALWYGPASKVVTGLGLLMPVPGRAGFSVPPAPVSGLLKTSMPSYAVIPNAMTAYLQRWIWWAQTKMTPKCYGPYGGRMRSALPNTKPYGKSCMTTMQSVTIRVSWESGAARLRLSICT